MLLFLFSAHEISLAQSGVTGISILLQVTNDESGAPDSPDKPLHMVGSKPENDSTLHKPRHNEILIYFNRDIAISESDPPVTITCMTTGRDVRPRRLEFAVIEGESGRPRILKIMERGMAFMRRRKLPGRPNRDGHWFLIRPTESLTDPDGNPSAPFELYICTLIGDFNGNGEVEESERRYAEAEWGSDYRFVKRNIGRTTPPKPVNYASQAGYPAGQAVPSL